VSTERRLQIIRFVVIGLLGASVLLVRTACVARVQWTIVIAFAGFMRPAVGCLDLRAGPCAITLRSIVERITTIREETTVGCRQTLCGVGD